MNVYRVLLIDDDGQRQIIYIREASKTAALRAAKDTVPLSARNRIGIEKVVPPKESEAASE